LSVVVVDVVARAALNEMLFTFAVVLAYSDNINGSHVIKIKRSSQLLIFFEHAKEQTVKD
jgi:hypothetical protein